MQPSEKERTAFHEAGHFVAARVLRPTGGILDVSSRPVEGTLGHLGISLSEAELNGEPEACMLLIVVCLAGRAAETKLLGVPPEMTVHGASDDEAQVQYFLDLLCLADDERAGEWARLYQQACELVVRERDAISKQARKLMGTG